MYDINPANLRKYNGPVASRPTVKSLIWDSPSQAIKLLITQM